MTTSPRTCAWPGCGLALLLYWQAAGPEARAADFLLPGIQAKAAAGAGQTVSRGASAVFYNPANLSTVRGVQPEIDLSAAQISYTYQNSDTDTYDPSTLTTTTPLATVGIAANPIDALGLGLAILPTGVGGVQQANGVPAEIAPATFEPMNISRKQTSYRIAAGASWQLTPRVALGAGALYDHDSQQVTLTRSGTDNKFLYASYTGSSTQVSAGLRLTPQANYVIGLSYRTAGIRHYSGGLSANTASTGADPIYQDSAFTGVGYDPAQIGLGVEGRWQAFGLFFDYVRERWSGGRKIYKQGLGGDSDTIDMIDSNDFTIGARWWVAPRHRLEAAIGMDGGNMNIGGPVKVGGDRPAVGGIQVGQLEAVPRTVAGGAYRYALARSGYLELAGFYLNGTKTVPAGYTQAGTFYLRVVEASAGAAYSF